ncbi:cohesin domain-containing protein [Gemmatimonadota bacterium]
MRHQMQCTRRFHRPVLTGMVAVLLISLGACKMIVPVEPEEPIYDNPQDPQGTGYTPPETSITSGPSDGSTVSTSQVTFEWDGNKPDMLFRIRLDGVNWSPWVDENIYLWAFLDEAEYTFEVQSGYDPGQGNDPTLIDETPASVTFTVDAVDGPSMMFYPRLTTAASGSQFNLFLIAEEVSDLMLVSAEIAFDPAHLSVISVTDGNFMTSTGGSIASYHDWNNTTGRIYLNLATATGSPPGVSGTGNLVTIRFGVKSNMESDVTFVAANTVIRNTSNQTMTIQRLIRGKVRQP